ncbi:MAG: hypothetical protein AAF633_14815, partial [Chloroflexota bacterium]
LDTAWQLLDEVLQVDPNNPGALLFRSEIYQAQGEWVKSLTDLQSITGRYPKFVQAHLSQAYASWAVGNFDEATELASQAVKLDPSRYEAHSMLMEISIAQEDFENAERYAAAFRESMEGTAVDWETLLYYGSIVGEFDQMLIDADEALALYPEDENLLYYRALANINLNQTDLSEPDLVEAIRVAQDLDLLADAEVKLHFLGSLGTLVGDRLVITDETNGYVASIPDSWSQNFEEEPVIFSAERETENGIALVIMLAIPDLPAEIDSTIIADIILEELRELSDFQNNGLRNVSVAGVGGLARDYEFTFDGIDQVIGRQYYIIHQGILYLITTTATAADADEFFLEIESIVESFEFLE